MCQTEIKHEESVVEYQQRETVTMRALGLWQPWASLVAHGIKTIETRSWGPPASLIGQRIAIHATKKKVNLKSPFVDEWMIALRDHGHDSVSLPYGSIVCTAVLSDAWQVDGRRSQADGSVLAIGSDGKQCEIDRWGDFSVGRWLWFLSDVELYSDPLPRIGRQRLFKVTVPMPIGGDQ